MSLFGQIWSDISCQEWSDFPVRFSLITPVRFGLESPVTEGLISPVRFGLGSPVRTKNLGQTAGEQRYGGVVRTMVCWLGIPLTLADQGQVLHIYT